MMNKMRALGGFDSSSIEGWSSMTAQEQAETQAFYDLFEDVFDNSKSLT